MTYQEQLESKEWKDKRTQILIRDGHRCQICFNETDIKEMDAGFFGEFCFPNSREAISMDCFGDQRVLRAGIQSQYAPFIDGRSIIYSRKTPKWRRMVMGVRSLTKTERDVYDEYETEIRKFGLDWDQSLVNDYDRLLSAIQSVFGIRNSRVDHFCELIKQSNPIEFNWKFLLGLHVHHKYYVKGFLAWEYSNEALVTLCFSCHERTHKDTHIPIYNDAMELVGQYTYCYRCHGAGEFPEYHHVQNGICFRCSGAKYEELIGQ